METTRHIRVDLHGNGFFFNPEKISSIAHEPCALNGCEQFRGFTYEKRKRLAQTLLRPSSLASVGRPRAVTSG